MRIFAIYFKEKSSRLNEADLWRHTKSFKGTTILEIFLGKNDRKISFYLIYLDYLKLPNTKNIHKANKLSLLMLLHISPFYVLTHHCFVDFIFIAIKMYPSNQRNSIKIYFRLTLNDDHETHMAQLLTLEDGKNAQNPFHLNSYLTLIVPKIVN